MAGIILGMCPANERRSYNVTAFLIGWVHTQNDPCMAIIDNIDKAIVPMIDVKWGMIGLNYIHWFLNCQ